MDSKALEELKFPIGEFVKPDMVSADKRKSMMRTISSFPELMKTLVAGLESELNWRYRPDGWTIKQVVHHCADSHMNAFIRFKLTLTEDSPTIRPYFEARWAELPDTLEVDINESLSILRGVHNRWTVLLNNMSESDFKRIYIHPEHGQEFTLDQALANYDWHCQHHLAHIQQALDNKGNFN